jgi:hypothetical protein
MLRRRRLFGLVALLCLVGFAVEVAATGLAQASDRPQVSEARSNPPSAEPYQRGPRDSGQAQTVPQLPSGAEELLGLSVLAAVLYGLMASGLANEPKR